MHKVSAKIRIKVLIDIQHIEQIIKSVHWIKKKGVPGIRLIHIDAHEIMEANC